MGRLYCVEADYNYGRLDKVLTGWRSTVPNYSVMLGGGVHVVDLLMWLVDSPIVEVSAVGNKVCSFGTAFAAPDMVIAWARFANGTVGKVGANFGCMYPHFHKVTIYGTEGTIENGLEGATLVQSRDPKAMPTRIVSAYPGTRKGDLIPSFIDAILGRGKAEIDEADSFRAIAVCLAIDRSVHSGKPEMVRRF